MKHKYIFYGIFILVVSSLCLYLFKLTKKKEDFGHPYAFHRCYGAYYPDSNDLALVIGALEYADRVDMWTIKFAEKEQKLWILTTSKTSKPHDWSLQRQVSGNPSSVPIVSISQKEFEDFLEKIN